MESPPTGTVTFLFTDIEGSTRRWQDEPEAMRALLVEHDAILRDVIDKRHGFLFKHTGDGVAAVFASAADAINAAVDAQTRLQDVLPVRMGLHTGEAELRDGDYFGSALATAVCSAWLSGARCPRDERAALLGHDASADGYRGPQGSAISKGDRHG